MGKYKVEVDGAWSLEDLSKFARNYEQVYAFAYVLVPHEHDEVAQRGDRAFQAFPWRGGYSAVNFYDLLRHTVPPVDRPMIVSIRYASPGFIELGLVTAFASSVALIVKLVAGSLANANATYTQIMKDLQKRKLLRLEVRRKELELTAYELQLIEQHANTMARLLGFRDHEALTRKTGHPFLTLKILLSFYRRVRALAEYIDNGKAKF